MSINKAHSDTHTAYTLYRLLLLFVSDTVILGYMRNRSLVAGGGWGVKFYPYKKWMRKVLVMFSRGGGGGGGG